MNRLPKIVNDVLIFERMIPNGFEFLHLDNNIVASIKGIPAEVTIEVGLVYRFKITDITPPISTVTISLRNAAGQRSQTVFVNNILFDDLLMVNAIEFRYFVIPIAHIQP